MVHKSIAPKKKIKRNKKKKAGRIISDNPHSKEDFEKALEQLVNYPYPEKK